MNDQTQRRLAAIVCADVVGYSRLLEVDEAGTHRRMKARFQRLVQPKIEAYGGRLFKLMGDGFLAEFPNVVSATEWAVDVQGLVAADKDGRRDEAIALMQELLRRCPEVTLSTFLKHLHSTLPEASDSFDIMIETLRDVEMPE
jgi:class 3 adenylate cyclase